MACSAGDLPGDQRAVLEHPVPASGPQPPAPAGSNRFARRAQALTDVPQRHTPGRSLPGISGCMSRRGGARCLRLAPRGAREGAFLAPEHAPRAEWGGDPLRARPAVALAQSNSQPGRSPRVHQLVDRGLSCPAAWSSNASS